MPVVRIILFKTKAGATEEQKNAFIDGSKALRGVVPGLLSLEIGPSIDMARAKGYDMGIVLVLESPAHIKIFAEHPAHLRLHDMREAISEDSLAFMLETS
ncbi:stress responsive A/B barrel domain protein [Hyaloscypha variabilis F]|uniref:Stress responsive A/B barrel domain protein n=1 Tax=Hyaloscypha variabilis (strain UAMH 11265 / GT02V1 / F) TaxID=1149755 RepID=A0A2J6SE51_HYAVF|nr:stress responsive A/B barrel domain protein [Hyaloscypha variabilis F]